MNTTSKAQHDTSCAPGQPRLDGDDLKDVGRPFFALPPREHITPAETRGKRDQYGLYNYYGRGPIARAKRARFERALVLGRDRIGGKAIDMGAADGVLVPSLSRLFEEVVAIDRRRDFVDSCRQVIERMSLTNARAVCNDGKSVDDLRRDIGPGFNIMFLLETLEHIGSQPDIYASKVEFLRDCFDLLEADGVIVISVPKMVGLIMLFKNLLQRSLALGYDKMTMRQLLKSAFLKDTDELEPLWDGHHVGFNHLKLDRYLADNFHVQRRVESLISVFYVLQRNK